MMFLSACQVQEAKPEPYEYTSNTEMKQIELYEYSHIKGIDKTEVTSLAKLGYPDLILAGEGSFNPSSIEYSLPDNAAQGPDTWYTVKFHFIIEFADETGNGFCDVTAGINNGAAAMVNFETMTVNDSPYIRILGQSSTSTRM